MSIPINELIKPFDSIYAFITDKFIYDFIDEYEWTIASHRVLFASQLTPHTTTSRTVPFYVSS